TDLARDAAQEGDPDLRQGDVDRHRELLTDRAGRQGRGGAAIARVAFDDQDAFGRLALAEERSDRAADDATADNDNAPRPIHPMPLWSGHCRAERRICELRWRDSA